MSRRYRILYLGCLLLFIHGKYINAQADKSAFSLIPYPASIVPGKGFFSITPATVIVEPPGKYFNNESSILNELFTNSFGAPLHRKEKAAGKSIRLVFDASITDPGGYHLRITSQEVTLSAKSPAGMFMAIQTLRQLLPPSVESSNSNKQTILLLPALTIRDAPVFAWRGMHLDVSRHFFPVAYLKKFIDLMALYKLNKFHLHLTDDQGWRIEIKKYPKLTEEGAWRSFNNQDSSCMERAKDNPDFVIDPAHIVQRDGKTMYGGFYTQEEMKDIVAYATARHIDVIPEIDMPGHMMAAINSYKYLSCDGKSAFGELFSIPMCPCLPSTFQFAKDVFTEIMDIFPGKYIHIGGDEVDRIFWEKSEACQALMAKEGMKSTAELQSYFIRTMERFFNDHGRTLIGWDEILEGGISKTAAITYWRIWVPKAPIDAVKNGNKVVMASLNPLYFSQQPDKNSLHNVYGYNPLPEGLTTSEAKNIMGAQGNLWTEQVPSEKRADYLLMPAMTALAEVLWTRKKNYRSYLKRLNNHYTRLDRLQVNYRLPDLPVLENYAFSDKTTLRIDRPLNNLVIRYTTDSTVPNTQSNLLAGALQIDQPQHLRLAAFKTDGTRGDIYGVNFKKESYAEPVAVSATKEGLMCSWYKTAFKGAAYIPTDKPDGITAVPNVVVPKDAEAPVFALRYKGYINVPEEGVYTFYLTSDDGAVLRIANREVVNNDGMHAPREKNGQVVLKKGLHPITIDFVEGGGGYTLKLQYSKEGNEPKNIPDNWFRN